MKVDAELQTFEPDQALRLALACYGMNACACHAHQRRTWLKGMGGVMGLGFSGLLAADAWAQTPVGDGVRVSPLSMATRMVPAEDLEQAAAQQYQQLLRQAQSQQALAPANHPQLVRLRTIAERIIPHVESPNLQSTPRARQWRWEVNLIGSKEINAMCMPGGKIVFYTGILQTLQLSDDEVAMIMGHEVAHALREHARERVGKQAATNMALSIGSALLGLGDIGRTVAGMGGQLLSLTFSRSDESEADLIGMDLAARAGYDPAAGITLWQKMARASRGAPPQFLSTHPSSDTRIHDMERTLPQVAGLYARAPKPTRRFGPPPA